MLARVAAGGPRAHTQIDHFVCVWQQLKRVVRPEDRVLIHHVIRGNHNPEAAAAVLTNCEKVASIAPPLCLCQSVLRRYATFTDRHVSWGRGGSFRGRSSVSGAGLREGGNPP